MEEGEISQSSNILNPLNGSKNKFELESFCFLVSLVQVFSYNFKQSNIYSTIHNNYLKIRLLTSSSRLSVPSANRLLYSLSRICRAYI